MIFDDTISQNINRAPNAQKFLQIKESVYFLKLVGDKKDSTKSIDLMKFDIVTKKEPILVKTTLITPKSVEVLMTED